VRVNGTTARCEFVSSFTAGDYVLGTCDAQGHLNLTPSYAYPSGGGGGGGSSAGASGQVQTSDGAGGFTAPTNVLAGANFCSVGGTPALSGSLRVGNSITAIAARNATNNADVPLLQTDGSDYVYLGNQAARYVAVSATADDFILQQVGNGTVLRIGPGGLMQVGLPMALGTNPASTGQVRLPNAGGVVSRDVGNASDMSLIMLDTGNRIRIGVDGGFGSQATNVWIFPATSTSIGVGSANIADFNASNISIYKPITGDGSTSPYSAHGGFSFAMAILSGSYTVTAAQYQYDHCEFTTGTLTGGFTTVWPAPASLAVGYYKTITNATTQTMTISTGSGTTKTLATNLTARFWFDSAGVQFASSTFTR
jgi:hypothetical protein